jgi:PAS domain S-box-containing protein
MNEHENADSRASQAGALRREAEQRLSDKQGLPAQGKSEVDVRALLHELQVHQIELEMQNEELMRAQAALQAVSDKYQDLFDFAPIGYFLLCEPGRILQANLAGAALLGLERSAVVNTPFAQHVAPQTRARFAEFCEDVLRNDGKQTCEIVLQRGQQRLDAVVEGIRIHDSGKGKRSFRVAVIDVTERKRVEAAVRQSHDELQAIYSGMLDGLLITDVETRRFVKANPAVCRLLGYSEEELLSLSVAEIHPPEALPKVLAQFQALVEDRLRVAENCPVLRKDGTVSYVDIGSSRTVLGDRSCAVGFFHDVTERRRAEEALQRTTAELARSNKDLEQFAYVASHDLQEPLRAVSGFVQLLQQKYGKRLDAQADEFIGYAVDGAKRMETLIRDLLAYSRIGSGGREAVPTDSGAVLRLALLNLRTSIDETAAEITNGELPTVRGDAGQLAQLFQNLIGNALKFHGEAPPRIHVDASRKEDGWLFSVRDNGIGIDPKHQDRIFDIFQRLHTRAQYAGTGIGLAVCKRIVDRHGGQIWVESEPGQGATFRFTLPI